MRATTLLALVAAFTLVEASSGDRLSGFQHCVSHCMVSQCSTPHGYHPSLALRLTRWTCGDDCEYTCSHSTTDNLIAQGERIHQFYGKWPFWRFAGMQEPASVLFSLFNLAAHAQGFRAVRRHVARGHPMRPFMLLWGAIAVNAWIWSAVFHTRDKPLTERLDYISAGGSIFYSLFLVTARVFGLWDPSGRTRLTASTATQRTRPWLPAAVMCTLAFAAHVLYATRNPRFDYGYNIQACLVIGMVHNALWVLYSYRQRHRRRTSSSHHYTIQPAIAVGLMTCAMGFELLDFPAWRRTVDAHALWHLSTAPIVVYWYDFLIKDAKDEAQWIGSAREKLPP